MFCRLKGFGMRFAISSGERSLQRSLSWTDRGGTVHLGGHWMNNVASGSGPGFHARASALGAVLALGVAGLLLPSQAGAADPPQSIPVRVGVMAPYMVQPGGTASAFYEIPLDEPVEGEGPGLWRSKLFVGPQIGVFTRPDNHSSVLAGGLFGYRLHSPGGCCFHDVSLGLA